MKFSEITTAVSDLWEFCWPPVFACLLLYGLWGYLVPSQLLHVQSQLFAYLSTAGKALQTHHEALEPFGLNKLVPFLTLFLVVATLFLISRMVGAARRLPPNLIFSHDEYLRTSQLTLKQKLLLIRNYPLAEHFNAAYYMAQRDMGEVKLRSGLRTILQLENFLKFSILATVFLFLDAALTHARLGPLLMRYLELQILELLIFVFLMLRRLNEEQQQASESWSIISLKL